MNVLICHRPGGAFGYITDSWLNALRDAGHRAERWSGNQSDWQAFAPDLYIGCSGHRQPIPQTRQTKVAIHVNPFGPIDIPGIMESKDSIDWVRRQNPDAVFGYAHDTDSEMWSYYQLRMGVPFVPMATAGDLCSYYDMNGVDRDNDVVYVGGRWGYKAKTIDSYLFPVLKQNQYVLAGWGDWPSWVNAKQLDDAAVNAFFNTAKVAPCISEYHTHTHGIDLPERVWKTLLAGCLPIHDAAKGINRYLPSIPFADSPIHFSDLVSHYVKNDGERVSLVQVLKRELLSLGHTYHHRLAGLFKVLGFEEQSLLEAANRRIN